MKLLITGFDPFGGESVNPAWEAVKLLPNTIDGALIIKEEVPTVFKKSYEKLYENIKKHNPDIVICVGQAGGRFDFTVERVAINIDDGRIPDNDGYQPSDATIFEDGENAYFSTLPIKNIVNKLIENKIPASVSNSAGTYVCNHIMYSLLHYINKNDLDIMGGFVHVPYIPEQVLDKKNMPFFQVDMITQALEITIKESIKSKKI